MSTFLPFRRWAAAAGALGFLLMAAGCASVFIAKTPENAVRYPYIPVSADELKNAKALVAISPKDSQAVKARFLIAQDAFNRKKWSEANKRFSDLFRHHPRSEWGPVAGLMAARSREQTKNYLLALAVLNELRKTPAGQEPPLAEAASSLARGIINDDLDVPDLAKVRAMYPDTDWAQQALFVTAKRTLDSGQAGEAAKLFKQFIAAAPQSEYAPVARQLLEKAMQLAPVDRTLIGCILPLSGPYAPFGKAIQAGLELALNGVNQQRPENQKFGLMVADSEADTQAAATALEKLAETDKALTVIGPALSASARALMPDLDRLQIPMISPSASDPGLAGQSPYFFRYLLTNEQQGEAMAEFAVLRQGLKRFGILHSKDRYDRSLADAFAAKVQSLGAEIVVRQEYNPGTTDFKEQMLAMGGVDPGRMKRRDLEERKALDRALDKVAYDIGRRLAPQALIASQTPIPLPKATPIPAKRVAIIRFAEEGPQTQLEQLGRLITERFSYSLAGRPGLEVLTQRKTLDALQDAGLDALSLDSTRYGQAGEALQTPYLVLGKIKQKEETLTPVPGEALPVHYTVNLRLVDAHSGRALRHFNLEWEKRIPPQANVKQVEAVYLPVSIEDALLIAPQLAFYDLDAKMLGCDAWVSPRLLREGTDSLNGAMLATGYWPDDPNAAMQAFIKRFEETYSEAPSLLAAQAYDTLQLTTRIANEVVRSGGNREDFVNRLRLVRDFNGVTGKATVEPDGEIRRTPIFLNLENGALKRIE